MQCTGAGLGDDQLKNKKRRNMRRPVFLIYCENGALCRLPGWAGTTWEDEDGQPYEDAEIARSVMGKLYEFGATCGPHVVARLRVVDIMPGLAEFKKL